MSAPGYTIGATSITVGSTSNWSTDTGVVFAIDEAQVVNGVEVQVAGTYNEYVGVVSSGTSVTSVAWKVGVGDRNYASGALTRVYIPVSAERENRLVDGLLVSHDQDGTLKAGAVDVAAVLANDVVETAKIKDKAVILPKINGGATAGVLQTDASGNVTANNVSFCAYRTGVQTGANGATIQLNAELYDTASAFSTSTYTFTAPVAGLYHFDGNIQTGVGTSVLSGVGVTSATYGSRTYRGSWVGGGPYIGSHVSADVRMSANDTLTLICMQMSGTATVDESTTGNLSTYLSGHLVSRL